MKKKRLLALSMAAVTALTSTSICAYADGQDSEALAAAITIAKTRLDIPEEFTEFSYSVSNHYLNTTYELTWTTPSDADTYGYATATVCGKLVLSYYSYNSGESQNKGLAELSGDKLYKKAQAAIKKLNPSVAKVISIDRDSLNISTYSSRATFSFVRTKNGIPVKSDSGSITLDKDTGEVLSYDMNWHEKASFKSADGIISEEKAKESYAEMIGLTPQYEFDYDWETGKTTAILVYSQSDSGEINAYTGKKSNFSEDGYYSTTATANMEEAADTAAEGEGGYSFTEQEQKEIDKQLPYASEEAIVKLLKSNSYLTYSDDMEMESSYLYKVSYDTDKYYFYAYFTNYKWEDENYEEVVDVAVEEDLSENYQTISITVDAESGQLISYSMYDSTDESASSYDLAKADSIAKEIAEKYSGDKYSEFGNYTSCENYYGAEKNRHYSGSYHTLDRYSDGILVSGDMISVSLNSDMKLRSYSYTYTDIALPDPSNMLTVQQVMDKFWESNSMNLYYRAAFNDKKVKTVLVYGTDSGIYADAFTGEQVYNWSSYENDLSGIKSKSIKKMATVLDEHGFLISSEKFSEDDAADYATFQSLMEYSSDSDEADKKLTRGEAVVLFTKTVAGDTVPALKGIYKSPFSDVKDDDENVGYYAIAYAMGVVSGKKLNADADFTMGDMIKMVYTYYSQM